VERSPSRIEQIEADRDRLAFDLSYEAGIGNPRDLKERFKGILAQKLGTPEQIVEIEEKIKCHHATIMEALSKNGNRAVAEKVKELLISEAVAWCDGDSGFPIDDHLSSVDLDPILGEENIDELDRLENRVAELERIVRAQEILLHNDHRATEAEEERDALAKFKAYVHARLDDAGVPVDPESPHKAEGCRIGGRLDVLLGERDATAVKVQKLEAVRDRVLKLTDGCAGTMVVSVSAIRAALRPEQ
jgi:D-ribose pyranose/furanose isomerase RbsD